MPDHEVHEIQLNGKQLVFMFMAATVVAVVIFLSGVMVGRGVRLPEADVLAATAATADPIAPPDALAAGASAKVGSPGPRGSAAREHVRAARNDTPLHSRRCTPRSDGGCRWMD